MENPSSHHSQTFTEELVRRCVRKAPESAWFPKHILKQSFNSDHNNKLWQKSQSAQSKILSDRTRTCYTVSNLLFDCSYPSWLFNRVARLTFAASSGNCLLKFYCKPGLTIFGWKNISPCIIAPIDFHWDVSYHMLWGITRGCQRNGKKHFFIIVVFGIVNPFPS